jgi:hypothetical protein
MKKLVSIAVALLLLLPLAATAQSIKPGLTGTRQISPASPARYVYFQAYVTSVASGTLTSFVYPYPGGARLVDVVVSQVAAGTGGTSVAVDAKNAAVVSLLTTPLSATLASGANVVTDARGNLSLPSGWTRPVIKTDATPVVAQGASIQLVVTETGAYTVHPVLSVTFVFDPLT